MVAYAAHNVQKVNIQSQARICAWEPGTCSYRRLICYSTWLSDAADSQARKTDAGRAETCGDHLMPMFRGESIHLVLRCQDGHTPGLYPRRAYYSLPASSAVTIEAGYPCTVNEPGYNNNGC